MKKKGISTPLSGDELRGIIEKLGWTQTDLAELGGVSDRQGRRLVKGGMASFDAILMRLLAAHPELVEEALKHSGLPGGRQATPRGRPKKKGSSSV
ncbi:MAG: hypothetical protein GY927_09675 [bacterium]|nr:hypothetical protein [bacterium]